MRSDETQPALADPVWIPQQRRVERGWMAWALAAALLVHVLLFFVHLPGWNPPIGPSEEPPVVIRRVVLTPPPIRRVTTRRTSVARSDPIPVPAPRDLPIAGVEGPREVEPPEASMPVLLGEVESPPVSGPRIPGRDGVTNPVLIPETKVEPDYPELARTARIQGKVILQAVIGEDGAVSEVEVLRCSPPDVGFERAAIEAIRRWRYEPALQSGRPVDVYFTIVVHFELR